MILCVRHGFLLNFSNNRIGTTAAQLLALGLKHNKGLESLWVGVITDRNNFYLVWNISYTVKDERVSFKFPLESFFHSLVKSEPYECSMKYDRIRENYSRTAI